jgi:hypothetical protein
MKISSAVSHLNLSLSATSIKDNAKITATNAGKLVYPTVARLSTGLKVVFERRSIFTDVARHHAVIKLTTQCLNFKFADMFLKNDACFIYVT